MIYILGIVLLCLLGYVSVAAGLAFILSITRVFNADDSAFFALLWPLWPAALVVLAVMALGLLIVVVVNGVANVAVRRKYWCCYSVLRPTFL